MRKTSVLCLTVCALALAGEGRAGETRTVTGAFTTVFVPDDGSSTTLSTPPPPGQRAVNLLAPDDGQTGYTVFPITLEADNTFTVEGVPSGSYFLQMDARYLFDPVAVYSNLTELTVDSPDLSTVSAARPDLARVTRTTPVTLDIADMQPWQAGNVFIISSSQGDAYVRPLSARLDLPPSPGDTSYHGAFDWALASTGNTPGLPDSARGDVVFFNQRSQFNIGSTESFAQVRYASRYARVTDFTAIDGAPSTLTASLVETPMTGQMRADLRGNEFAALAPQVNPSARPAPGGNLNFSIQAVPHTVQYPDRPASAASSIFYYQSLTSSSTDLDYGAFHYPQFHDSFWAEFGQLGYCFDVTLLMPGTEEPIELQCAGRMFSALPMSPPLTDPIAPVLGPPTAPLINGEDGFAPHAGVGLEPVISWSPPDLGTATSYLVSVRPVSFPEEGERLLTARVYSSTSFKVPPGFLRSGRVYYANISAYRDDNDVLDRPVFRLGTPSHQTDCVIGAFTP